MVDVAALAGVSYQTVSRVVNDHTYGVAEETRQRVLGAIQQLGYHPNRAARTLRTGRGSTIAVFASNTTLYGYTGIAEGVEEAARQAGLSVSITVLKGVRSADVEHIAQQTLTQPLAGVIALAHDAAGTQALSLVPDHLPAVAVGGSPDTRRPRAILDERAGATHATNYLLSLGHRTVHHVRVPNDDGASDRSTGWQDALRSARRRVPAVIQGTWEARSGYDAGIALAQRTGVSAVLCGNDELAMGLIRGLFDRGLRVPEDVSVIGFDDQPFAEFMRPALTTVRQRFPDLGRAAVKLLLAQMDGQAEDTMLSVASTELVVRESTAPPPGAGARGRSPGSAPPEA
jgi:DNA-binding LacI/PurR family transcriptional regulator